MTDILKLHSQDEIRMSMKFIICSKNLSSLNKNNFKQLLKPICTRINSYSINFMHDQKEEEIEYNILNYTDNSICFVITSYKNNQEENAIILENFSEYLLKQLSNYKLIIIYDEPSNYFCTKIEPLFAEFERKLRQLLYMILLKVYGINWINETLDIKSQNYLKKKLHIQQNTDLSIDLLEELTYGQLEDYLFKINNTKFSQSIWDKLFSKYINLNNFEIILSELHQNRNKVMHNKTFIKKDYDESKENLEISIVKINEAIEIIKWEIFTEDINKYIKLVISDKFKHINEQLEISFNSYNKNIKNSIHKSLKNNSFKRLKTVNNN